ncbi:MAG: KinB-signaling pathway activation protein, partial [Bacilli bacterium]
MKSRSWVRLFLTTLLLGGVSTLFFGLIVKWSELSIHISSKNMSEIFALSVWLLGTGFTFSVVS